MRNKLIVLISILFYYGIIFGQEYKIMTYNIRYDNPNDGENQWSKRKDYLSDQIAFYEPDVFGIQEGLHHQVKFLDDKLNGYSYVGIGRDDGKTKGEYSAVFYKKDKFKVLKHNTFWLSDTPDKISVGWDASMERICTYALLKDKKSKKKFWIFNTHFDHIGNKARVESTKLIVQKIKELNHDNLPVIVMGDLNSKPESEQIKYLSGVLNDAIAICKTTPFGPIGTYNGWHFDQPVTRRIDYIFVSKNNIEVLRFAVLSDSKNLRYPSDHLPVFIQIRI